MRWDDSLSVDGDDWKKRDRMNFAAWIKPKQAYNSLVQAMLQRLHPECGDFFKTRIQISQRRRA